MNMDDFREQLVRELTQTLPELKGKEGLLWPLLDELLSARPKTDIDPSFRAELKRRLLAHGLVRRVSVWRRWRVYAPLAGAVAVATLVILIQTRPQEQAIVPAPIAFDRSAAPPQVQLAAGGGPSESAGAQTMSVASNKSSFTMKITSSAFQEGEMIPDEYSCNGAGLTPPLSFAGVPADAVGLALIVEDPDAPAGTFTHWVVWNIPPTTAEMAEGKLPR